MMGVSVGLTISGYQRAANRTINPALDNRENLINAALGLAGEAGEVADLIKKHVYHGHELDKEKVSKELGDILWYLTQAAKAIEIPLYIIAEQNIEKLEKRYPFGFTSERSINRSE